MLQYFHCKKYDSYGSNCLWLLEKKNCNDFSYATYLVEMEQTSEYYIWVIL